MFMMYWYGTLVVLIIRSCEEKCSMVRLYVRVDVQSFCVLFTYKILMEINMHLIFMTFYFL